MEKNLNCLNKLKYIIDSNLQKNLLETKNITDQGKIQKNIPGAYIINFRVFNRSKKILVYNYVYYRLDLYESIILYLLSRNHYENTDNIE